MKKVSLLSDAKVWLGDLARLFFPPVCYVCGKPLVEGEEVMCLECSLGMPRTNYHLDADNPLHYKLLGRVKFEKAAALFHYARNNPYSRLITVAKYNSHSEIVRFLGRTYASELQSAGFFNGVDLLVPVPMHWWKKVRRGYNQATEIAKGVSQVTGIEVCEALKASSHSTQTRKNAYERLLNARETYRVVRADALENRHILLIDDVITTGATISTCAEIIHKEVPSARISVLALASTYNG